MRKTSFNVTKSALQFENILIKELDIPRTTFHRKMIDYFIQEGAIVHPYLKITKRSDPNYVKREEVEQIYLDEKRELQLREVAEKNDCKLGTMLFQAMLTYSVAIAPEVLGKTEMRLLFPEIRRRG